MLFTRTVHVAPPPARSSLLAAAASIAVVATPGRARQAAGTTLVITPVGKEALAFTDVKPAGFRHNRFSLGDQLILTSRIIRDGKVTGTEQATITISEPCPVVGDRAHGVVSAEVGVVAVIGGTRAYRHRKECARAVCRRERWSGRFKLADGRLQVQGASDEGFTARAQTERSAARD